MKNRALFLFVTGFISLNIFSQIRIDTIRLLYNINEIRSEENNKRLDSLVTGLNGRIIKMKIFGYADFLHSTPYNQTLSQKRADAVKDYLLQKMPPSQVNTIVSKGMGEKFSKNNNSPLGEAFQRRVDVIIEPFTIVQNSDNNKANNSGSTAPKTNTKTIEDLSKGESLSLEGLNFEPGRHFVVKEAVPILYKLLKTMQTNKNLKIEIQGHICCLTDGDDGMDMDTRENKLSKNRAKAVYDFLVSNHIDPKRLSYEGFGRSQPKIFPERTPEDEQMNRRVEIKIVDK